MPSPSNNPIPVALESLLTDIFRQYEATEEQAKAWLAVSSQLKAGNPELFAPRVTGLECALLEVKRLQQCASELAELSQAKGKADAAPTQQPSAVPTKQVHGDTKAAYFTGAASQANAGPEPGDRLIDRFIASVPLPTYDLKKPPAAELPVLPDHPDPLTYRWSEAEKKAISEYGRLSRAAGLEEAAKAVEAIACPCCWTDDAIELAGTAIEDIRALNK